MSEGLQFQVCLDSTLHSVREFNMTRVFTSTILYAYVYFLIQNGVARVI